MEKNRFYKEVNHIVKAVLNIWQIKNWLQEFHLFQLLEWKHLS